jgi:site-specific DNA-methyltransferase (adenine-specific)
MNEIIHSDSLVYLKTLSDKSIDMCLTDIPYGYHHLDNNWSTTNLSKNQTNSHISLPKGMKFDKQQGIQLQEFMNPIAKEIFRVLKPGGFFLCFSAPRLYHRVAIAVEDSGFEIRDSIAWLYTQSQVKAFRQDHVIDKDPKLTNQEKKDLKDKLKNHRTPQLKPTFENILVAMKPVENRFIDNEMKYGLGLIDCSVTTGDDKFPCNTVSTDTISPEIDAFFFVKKANKQEKENNTHPTVKPLELCEHLIKLFTKEDDLVLDPFMGSGTSAVAAINTSRYYCGCDINKDYIEISNKRVSQFRDGE